MDGIDSLHVLHQELCEAKCRDLLRARGDVLEIPSCVSVEEACSMLVARGVSSAPVRSADTYIGMLDYRDIVDFVLAVFHKDRGHSSEFKEASTNHSESTF